MKAQDDTLFQDIALSVNSGARTTDEIRDFLDGLDRERDDENHNVASLRRSIKAQKKIYRDTGGRGFRSVGMSTRH